MLLAWLAAALLAAVNVWFGPLNADEGWYLLAAQNVSRGMVPYRDFLYTQGPVLPFVYGAFGSMQTYHQKSSPRARQATAARTAAAATRAG